MANYYKNGVAMNTLAGWTSSKTTTGYGNMGGFTSNSTGMCNFRYGGVDIVNGVATTYYVEYTSGSGTITIPTGCTQIQLIAIGAGSGGEGGFQYLNGNAKTGGSAGPHGQPGCAGGYSTSYFTISGTTSYSYVVGSGSSGLPVIDPNNGKWLYYPPIATGGSTTLTCNGTTLTVTGGTCPTGSYSTTGGTTSSSANTSSITGYGGSSTTIAGLTLYGNSTGNATTVNYTTDDAVPGNTTNSPTASLPYISGYGSGGTGGAGANGSGSIHPATAGGTGTGGYIRVYYLF